MNTPLRTLETTVIEDWIDYNGHLNDAYYLVIFTKATDALQTHLGMTVDSINKDGFTLFTVETHLLYKQEIGLGKDIYITSQIIASDSKRLRIFQRMFNTDDELLASVEMLFVSYNLQQQRVVDFKPEFATKLQQLIAQQRDLPTPPEAGKGITLKRK